MIPNYHLGKWFRCQHPESPDDKFVRAALQIESGACGDVYDVFAFSSRPYGFDPLLDAS